MKIYKTIKFFLFITLGISIFFLKEIYLENLQYFIGGLITLYGIDGFLLWLLEKDRHEKVHFIFKAAVQLILGLCTIGGFDKVSTVCVIWGVWAIMREADEISEYYELFKERIPCLLGFIESIVAIVFSIFLISLRFNSFHIFFWSFLFCELLVHVICPFSF